VSPAEIKKAIDMGAGALLMVKTFDNPVMCVEGDSAKGPWMIFVVSGEENCKKLKPVVDRMCPRAVIRDGEPVSPTNEGDGK
jgi:hypothetical protein